MIPCPDCMRPLRAAEDPETLICGSCGHRQASKPVRAQIEAARAAVKRAKEHKTTEEP